jgi:hypothetical protein
MVQRKAYYPEKEVPLWENSQISRLASCSIETQVISQVCGKSMASLHYVVGRDGLCHL